ncbi:transketolase [Rickettsiales bacterium]|nr:transketolase [Rickettsiales bacterium]
MGQAKQQSDSSAVRTQHKDMANAIRALSMDAVQKANSGHPGMPMGMADVATVLFREFLKFNPKDPKWADRDRFILSAGHGSMLLYSLLYLTGYEDITIEDIKNFRQFGAKTAGHPEYGYAGGIETTTGPLGQGLANSVGFALAERMMNSRYGDDIVDHYTYVIAGDGCLMEGISQEAISLAGHLKLDKLIVLFDDNGITIDGSTDLATSEDHIKRFEACGWDAVTIDGHDEQAISDAISAAKKSDKPSLIACKTTIAYGAPTKAGTSSSHGAPLGDDEISGTRKAIGWDYAPFEVPENILSYWSKAGERSKEEYNAWQGRYNKMDKKEQFDQVISGQLTKEVSVAFDELKKKLIADKPNMATRKSSNVVLEAITAVAPEMIGGSADLTGSNLTKTQSTNPVTKDDFSGSYIYYGIREHGMAAAMNGIALHGGFIPYGATFLVFTDYCRASIRLSALMHQRVIYVMTHDSIGLGEDGPTHQPVEHLISLRAIPNLFVYRPADAVETAECWQLSLEKHDAPSVLALTRQNLPTVRTQYSSENKCAKGAYILKDADAEFKVTIFATGSEVEIALDAKNKLEEKGVGVRVISVPCVELYEQQDKEYRMSLVCNDSIKVAIEAASPIGWDRFIGAHGIFIGMQGFGASAPAEELYEHFGITAENVVERVLAKLDG